MAFLILIIPLLAIPLFWVCNRKSWLHLINCTAAGLLLLTGCYITLKVLRLGSVSYPWFHQLFYLDSLSVIVLDTTVLVSLMVSIYAVGYLNQELQHQVVNLKGVKIFYSLTYAFIFTMILVLTTQNLGVIWIAIEATTLASAFLVGFYNDKEAIEAAWKYVIICSVGIAFALLGIVLLYFAAVKNFAEAHASLNWLFLWKNAGYLHSDLLKLAFIFVLLGFGTKAGLAPMHTWLPDAHSQAPSPISALLSGVLLNSALYGIIRVLCLVNRNLKGSAFTGRLLMAAGLLSVIVAALFILTQKDYKRLLAYSSIEHMGLITFGLGVFTPLALFGSLLHLVNHALTKSMLFLASGNVFLKYRTREIAKVDGLLKIMPITGTLFLAGLLVIAGVPPFGVFASELNIFVAAFSTNNFWLAATLMIAVALVFAGIVIGVFSVFFSKGEDPTAPGEINQIGLAVMTALLLMVTLTGFYLPPPLKTLLLGAARIIKGGY